MNHFFYIAIVGIKHRNMTHPAEDQSDNNAYIGTAIFPAGCNTENIYLRLWTLANIFQDCNH